MKLNKFSKFHLFVFFVVLSSINSKEVKAQVEYADPAVDITLVAGATLGGAVLGLSTLPFTEEPGDHLKNILVGGAVGLIVGVGLVAYNQTLHPAPTYTYKFSETNTRTIDMSDHHNFPINRDAKLERNVSQVSYKIEF